MFKGVLSQNVNDNFKNATMVKTRAFKGVLSPPISISVWIPLLWCCAWMRRRPPLNRVNKIDTAPLPNRIGRQGPWFDFSTPFLRALISIFFWLFFQTIFLPPIFLSFPCPFPKLFCSPGLACRAGRRLHPPNLLCPKFISHTKNHKHLKNLKRFVKIKRYPKIRKFLQIH